MSESNSAAVPLPIITPASTSTPKGDTSYVLLRYVGGSASTGWEMLGVYPARDPDAAIKEYVETADKEDAAGPFVAIASKFWRPVTPAVEVVTTKTITLKAAN